MELMTPEEMSRLVQGIADRSITPDSVDWDAVHPQDRRTLLDLITYELSCRREEEAQRRRGPSQRRAHALLRSLISPAQNARLTRSRYFYVVGSAGGLYRLQPNRGMVWGCKRHGKNIYGHTSYCFHDPDNVMPPADLTIGHMMWIMSDEAAFLEAANARDVFSTTLWNGEWLSRLARKRKLLRTLSTQEAA